jgi:hypothetical protein
MSEAFRMSDSGGGPVVADQDEYQGAVICTASQYPSRVARTPDRRSVNLVGSWFRGEERSRDALGPPEPCLVVGIVMMDPRSARLLIDIASSHAFTA